MDHSSQIRIAADAEYAVLFLHGILGTPRHFSHVLPFVQMVPEGWSYYNLLLPGHGGSVEDFSGSSMKHWKEKVWEIFSQLAQTHRKVIIVGHSMGTLFALQLAMEFSEKIPLLFLLASPIRPWVSLNGISCCLRMTFDCARADDPSEMAILSAGGTVLTKRLWEYIPWIPNMLALLREAEKTKKRLPKLQTKTVVFQSRKDEMVALSSGKLLQKNPFVKLTTLDDSTHFYYPTEDAQRICRAFCAGCEWVQNREVENSLSKER